MNALDRTKPIRIAAVQMHPVPDDINGNLARISTMVRDAARDGAQLVVVPETATTAYFIADRLDRLAEPKDGSTAIALASLAGECGIYLAVGMAIAEDGLYYDAQLLFGPRGNLLASYRKAHLFSSEREWYAAGNEPVVVESPLAGSG